jgi:hypothetical protein
LILLWFCFNILTLFHLFCNHSHLVQIFPLIHQINRNLLSDYNVVINNQTFEVNYSFLCRCYDKFLQMNSNQSEMVCEIPNKYMKVFVHSWIFLQEKRIHLTRFSF